jgi:hypothetical protein
VFAWSLHGKPLPTPRSSPTRIRGTARGRSCRSRGSTLPRCFACASRDEDWSSCPYGRAIRSGGGATARNPASMSIPTRHYVGSLAIVYEPGSPANETYEDEAVSPTHAAVEQAVGKKEPVARPVSMATIRVRLYLLLTVAVLLASLVASGGTSGSTTSRYPCPGLTSRRSCRNVNLGEPRRRWRAPSWPQRGEIRR